MSIVSTVRTEINWEVAQHNAMGARSCVGVLLSQHPRAPLTIFRVKPFNVDPVRLRSQERVFTSI